MTTLLTPSALPLRIAEIRPWSDASCMDVQQLFETLADRVRSAADAADLYILVTPDEDVAIRAHLTAKPHAILALSRLLLAQIASRPAVKRIMLNGLSLPNEAAGN